MCLKLPTIEKGTMDAKCRYCNNEIDGIILTHSEEHIFPNTFYKRLGLKNARYSSYNPADKTNKDKEYKIDNVCNKCNNEILSALDTYIATELLKDCQFRDITNIKINYNNLTRWLLKTSFNSSVFGGIATASYKKHMNYILGEQEGNTLIEVFICSIKEATKGNKFYDSSFISIGELFLEELKLSEQIAISKYIQLMNLLFFVVVFNEKTEEFTKKVQEYLENKYSATLLHDQNINFNIREFDSKIDTYEVFNSNILKRRNYILYLSRLNWGDNIDLNLKKPLIDGYSPKEEFQLIMVALPRVILPIMIFEDCIKNICCEKGEDIEIKEYLKLKLCSNAYASIERNNLKTHITLYDENTDRPYFLNEQGTDQDKKNWYIFKSALNENNYIYLARIKNPERNKNVLLQQIRNENYLGNVLLTSKVKVSLIS